MRTGDEGRGFCLDREGGGAAALPAGRRVIQASWPLEFNLTVSTMMDRRNFLQLAAACVGTLFFRKGADEDYAAVQKAVPSVPLCLCTVAGVQYHVGPVSLAQLRPGQPLTLRREPENSHDELAIAVHAGCGVKLGYLPRRLNEIPANLMDSGRRVVARVVEVNPDAPPWESLVLEVGVG
ncbi:MAG: HIRAN domain-containing protein [Desulfobacteraceae bacterium]|nr:HIRAN domain-containing protein [Desulfobacteraceae bacterium]